MTNFQSLGLSPELVQSVTQMGFETPTPIQEQAIPLLLTTQKDLVGLAQTGTGKTAAFGLPLIDLMQEKKSGTQALILAPTRELSLQITSDLENFSKGVKDLNIVTVYGGASISDQIRKVKRGAHIIVATPGRLIDLLSRKAVLLNDVQYVVLDEADEMLNMGFKDDMDEILSQTPKQKRVWLFSATMPAEVRRIAENYMHNPAELSIGRKNQDNENIDHQYAIVEERDKYLALKRFVDYSPSMMGIIFCRTKIDTQKISDHLKKDGYNADALHGDLSQGQRDRVTQSFKNMALQLLVATDVAARGIDVRNITHVIHLNMPDEKEFYIHRSGRTARAGKKGISLALISRKELSRVKQVEQHINRRFTQAAIPTGEDICDKKLMDMVHRMRTVEINDEEIDSFLPEVYHDLKDMPKEEIIKRFAALEFNRFLAYYRDARDLNKPGGGKVPHDSDDARGYGQRLFINIGKMDGLETGALLDLICDFGKVNKDKVGKIDLKGAYSFFEIAPEHVEAVIDGFDGVEVRGRKVRLEVTGGRQPAERPERSNGKKKFSHNRSNNRKRRY